MVLICTPGMVLAHKQSLGLLVPYYIVHQNCHKLLLCCQQRAAEVKCFRSNGTHTVIQHLHVGIISHLHLDNDVCD